MLISLLRNEKFLLQRKLDSIGDSVEDYGDVRLNPGSAFSAIIPSSIIPTEISENDEEFTYDEFGFRIEHEDKPEPDSSKLLSIPFIEDETDRLKWIAHLEFSTNSHGDLNFESNSITKSEKLRNMIIFEGIPHSLRQNLWMSLSGAYEKRRKSQSSYTEIIKASNMDHLSTSKQIEKDLTRILPSNYCFATPTRTGIPRLRRILRALAWMFPDIGYCQGTGVIVASLLLFLEEEECFWLMATIVEDLLPASYYSSNLLGIQADQRVLQTILTNYLPTVDEKLKQHDIEVSLISYQWFLTLFASVVHMKILLRILDWFFCDGSLILFQITLGMIKIKEEDLLKLENSAQIFNALSDIPGEIEDVSELFKIALDVSSTLNQMVIDTHRRRHLAYLMIDQGALVGNLEANPIPNLPKQHLNKREVKKSKSMIQMLLFGNDDGDEDMKTKNIKNSEIIVELHDAILKIARHFVSIEPKLSGLIVLQADYSANSHVKDHENYVNVSRNRRRRAKALHDFERHDPDELGFRKNDIITIVSQKDEDCWVGELNGLVGWFPARFVELLDERSKVYVAAGDDSLCETVTDLVRGTLCPAIKQVLEHGMKRPSFLGGPCHPWLFIEEAANREVEKDFDSVYSRLVLCKTYRLDEDVKVLTPEELLYRCVQTINQSHVDVQMDVKLRSLICLGLNEQVLHLWLDVICNCTEIANKWYYQHSFINSPAYVQIKCELRILSQFSFNLNPDYELPATKKNVNVEPLKQGVAEMLVKHHLFSWDL